MQKIEVEIQIFFWFSLVLRIDRRGEMWLMFANVVHFHWKELLSAAYIGSIVLLLTAFAVFLLEQGLDDETSYETMGDALWWDFITFYITFITYITFFITFIRWAFITFYSVGYGDISPTTWAGKMVASCCCVFGMIMFNLPRWHPV